MVSSLRSVSSALRAAKAGHEASKNVIHSGLVENHFKKAIKWSELLLGAIRIAICQHLEVTRAGKVREAQVTSTFLELQGCWWYKERRYADGSGIKYRQLRSGYC